MPITERESLANLSQVYKNTQTHAHSLFFLTLRFIFFLAALFFTHSQPALNSKRFNRYLSVLVCLHPLNVVKRMNLLCCSCRLTKLTLNVVLFAWAAADGCVSVLTTTEFTVGHSLFQPSLYYTEQQGSKWWCHKIFRKFL